jgi:hypothetical protein
MNAKLDTISGQTKQMK